MKDGLDSRSGLVKLASSVNSNLLVRSTHELWLGGDRLVCVKREGYHEGYRQFPLADIQAFTLSKTARGTILCIVCLALTLLFGLATAALLAFVINTLELMSDREIMTYVVGGCGGLLTLVSLASLLIQLWRGPTCRMMLHTAVHCEEIGAVRHLRRGRGVIDDLEPRILRAQEGDSPELLLRARESLSPSSFARESLSPSAFALENPAAAEAAPTVERLRWAKITAWVMTALALASGILTLVQMAAGADPDSGNFLFAAVVILCVTMICVATRRERNAGLVRIAWALLVLYGALFMVTGLGTGIFIAGGFVQPEMMNSPLQMPGPAGMFIFSLAVIGSLFELAFGLFGLAACLRLNAPAAAAPPAGGDA